MSNTYFDIVNMAMNTKLVQYRHTYRILRYWTDINIFDDIIIDIGDISNVELKSSLQHRHCRYFIDVNIVDIC